MSYAKGVHYERSLLRFFETQGFSTIRVAGSGHNSPIDVLAVRNGAILAIECKAHTNKPKLQAEKVQEMRQWCDRASALGFLAWRAPKQEWKFLPLKDLETRSYADENWLTVTQLLEIL